MTPEIELKPEPAHPMSSEALDPKLRSLHPNNSDQYSSTEGRLKQQKTTRKLEP